VQQYKHAYEQMRDYEGIWTRLKKDHEVSITSPRHFHKRILKAVKKEKWMDLGYKLAIEPRRATLAHTRIGSILKFTLHLSLIEEDF
jgi:hypothetical protein